MISRKKISMFAVGLAVASLAVATPAMADSSGTLPSGCSISASAPTTVGTQKQVSFGGSANCGASSSADFRLVHDYTNGVPDARVTNVNIRNNGSGSYSYTGVTCDNGGTTAYYSEIRLYVTGSPQRVSKSVTLSHC